jgi:hypothetical protein
MSTYKAIIEKELEDRHAKSNSSKVIEQANNSLIFQENPQDPP